MEKSGPITTMDCRTSTFVEHMQVIIVDPCLSIIQMGFSYIQANRYHTSSSTPTATPTTGSKRARVCESIVIRPVTYHSSSTAKLGIQDWKELTPTYANTMYRKYRSWQYTCDIAKQFRDLLVAAEHRFSQQQNATSVFSQPFQISHLITTVD
jgi:hypothetical protein